MKKIHLLLYSILLVIGISCDDKIPDTPTPSEDTINYQSLPNGLSSIPQTPDADEPLTIVYKAAVGTKLYGHTGDLYIHTGVIDEAVWQFVPAEWNQNIAKCKITKVPDVANTWEITLSPSIRQWYNSGETPINQLGVVVRTADGANKTSDFFIKNITDKKFKGFEPATAKMASVPAGTLPGINITNQTTVTLALYDADASQKRFDHAHVVGDFNQWTLANDATSQMQYDTQSKLWWITLSGLDPNKEYAFQYYLKKGETVSRVADPYSRKILDPNNDKYIPSSTYPENKTYPSGGRGIVSTFKTTTQDFAWKVTDFKAPALDNLVIYELLLRDFSETGDLNGAMAKLDYLKQLGVNAIELMPVQEFDGNDSWGYNPAFFFAMDKAYGTDSMYKTFIDACHQRGIAVILDVVYNHATGDNPFAKMWWDTANNRTATNNPFFNVTAPHPYSVFHDFNHSQPMVQEFVKRNLTFLLNEYRIDGFRFDLTKGFTQQTSTEATASKYDASRIAILNTYNKAIKAVKSDAIVILEHFCDADEEAELSKQGMLLWRNSNHAFKQTAMGYSSESAFNYLYATSPYPSANSVVGFMESHDEERMGYAQTAWGVTSIKGNLANRMNQLKTNAAFFFTVPGPKMVWQFGEMGYDISIDQNGRTGRKPLKWDYLNVAERQELHHTYTQLIGIRHQHPELFAPTANLKWEVGVSNWNNGRTLHLSNVGKELIVWGNFTDTAIKKAIPANTQWHDYLNTGNVVTADSVTIAPHQFVLYTSFVK